MSYGSGIFQRLLCSNLRKTSPHWATSTTRYTQHWDFLLPFSDLELLLWFFGHRILIDMHEEGYLQFIPERLIVLCSCYNVLSGEERLHDGDRGSGGSRCGPQTGLFRDQVRSSNMANIPLSILKCLNLGGCHGHGVSCECPRWASWLMVCDSVLHRLQEVF